MQYSCVSMSVFVFILSILVAATVCDEERVTQLVSVDDDVEGMFLIQKQTVTSQVRIVDLLATDSSEKVLSSSWASHVSPVALLHIPYNHIAVNVSYRNLGEQILTFPERRPQEFNVMLATFKTWTADAIVQVLERRRGAAWSFDWRRSAAFAIFGFLYIGCMQWLLYVSILTWLFPDAMIFANSPLAMKLNDTQGQWDMLGQVLVDNFGFEVFVYFPAFYVIKGLMQSSSNASLFSRVQDGLAKYWNNIVSDNMASCAIWIPADLFIFACPMYLRMPLEHGVSFGWTMFMSFTRGKNDKSDKADPKCATPRTDDA